MTERTFRERLLDALDLKLADYRDLDGDPAANAIVRRALAVQENATQAHTQSMLWEKRFAALAEVAGEDAARTAMDASPSENRLKMLRWLDPGTDNFLGTGSSLKEMLVVNRVAAFNRSFGEQKRDEQDRRLDLVVRLSVEYQRVRTENIQGTGFLESAISDVFTGIAPDDFDERIEWMEDREGGAPVGLEDMPEEQQEAFREQDRRRAELWAPAIRISREYTAVFRPPPAHMTSYHDWRTMVSVEPGFAPLSREPDLFVLEEDLPAWRDRGYFMGRPCLGAPLLETIFAAGARWHGPDDEHNGYWYMVDLSPFPEGEGYSGSRYHRIFRHEFLTDWLARRREEGRPAPRDDA